MIKSTIASEPHRFQCVNCGSDSIVRKSVDNRFICIMCKKESEYGYDNVQEERFHIKQMVK